MLERRRRLSALVGDTAAAARAYRRYLILTSDADPRLQPEIDRVRSELEVLRER